MMMMMYVQLSFHLFIQERKNNGRKSLNKFLLLTAGHGYRRTAVRRICPNKIVQGRFERGQGAFLMNAIGWSETILPGVFFGRCCGAF
jgi:hypothetical protein